MAQHYSDPSRAADPHAWPDLETFHVNRFDDAGPDGLEPGWYYQACFPGCLPDSDPVGPFETEAQALNDARPDDPCCEIQWIDQQGRPTPDTDPAVGYVQREAYDHQDPHAVNGVIHYQATKWFPICEAHKARLTERGMEHWRFKPLD